MPIHDNDEPDGYHIASLEDVVRKIRRIKPYVDKMRIWFSENPHYDIEFLKSLCGTVKVNAKGKPGRRTRRKVKIADVWCAYKLDLFQPTRRAFEYMIENTRPSITHFVNGVEMSLDFTADSQEDVLFIRSFFERHWIKLWHKSKWLKRTVGVQVQRENEKDSSTIGAAQLLNQGTLYYDGRKKPGVHNKMYSDLPSKVNRKPCCHLEVTFEGYPYLRNARLDSLEAYQRPGIFYKFWRHYLQLKKAKDEDTVKNIIANTVRKNMRGEDEDKILNAIAIIFRACYYGEDTYVAQDIIDYGKYVSGREKLLEEVSNEPFLPSRAAKIPLALYKNRP